MDCHRQPIDICSKCHRLKTDWEQGYYGTGQGNELQNVTPINDVSSIVVLIKDASRAI